RNNTNIPGPDASPAGQTAIAKRVRPECALFRGVPEWDRKCARSNSATASSTRGQAQNLGPAEWRARTFVRFASVCRNPQERLGDCVPGQQRERHSRLPWDSVAFAIVRRAKV